jgi:hypothetical protein
MGQAFNAGAAAVKKNPDAGLGYLYKIQEAEKKLASIGI